VDQRLREMAEALQRFGKENGPKSMEVSQENNAG